MTEGGKFCLFLSLYFATFFVLLGRPLIAAWVGQDLAFASGFLAILVAGEVLPMSQGITLGVISMGR